MIQLSAPPLHAEIPESDETRLRTEILFIFAVNLS
jgi:hypothetical protein